MKKAVKYSVEIKFSKYSTNTKGRMKECNLRKLNLAILRKLNQMVLRNLIFKTKKKLLTKRKFEKYNVIENPIVHHPIRLVICILKKIYATIFFTNFWSIYFTRENIASIKKLRRSLPSLTIIFVSVSVIFFCIHMKTVPMGVS